MKNQNSKRPLRTSQKLRFRIHFFTVLKIFYFEGEEKNRRGKVEVQPFSYKINESRYEMYNVGNIVNNYLISLYGAR